MLTMESLEAAMPLTMQLDSRNIGLIPVAGTPLDALVNATRSDSNFMALADGEYKPSLNDIEYIANAKDPSTNISKHDVVADDIIEVAATAVKGHISFARSVVSPAISELVTETVNILSNSNIQSLTGMEIVVYNNPAPFDNSTLSKLAKAFEETPFDSPSMTMNLPNISGKEIIELMMTGTSSLDKDIEEWVSKKGESFFTSVWEDIFQQKQANLNDTKVKTFQDYIQNGELGEEYALVIFLLSRRLFDKPLPETGMNLSSYENLIADYRNQAGARLCRILDKFEEIEKNGILVKSVTGTVTVVNGTVYKKWIEEGGENEVLFGNLLETPYVTTVDSINAKAESLKALWNKHSLLVNTVEANKRFSKTKETLARVFEKQLREVDNAEFTTINRNTVMEKFNDELSKITDTDIRDIWTTALKLVCRSRFDKTDAERILSGMEQVRRDNPNIDTREAAAISIIDYIAYWMSSQFQVVAI